MLNSLFIFFYNFGPIGRRASRRIPSQITSHDIYNHHNHTSIHTLQINSFWKSKNIIHYSILQFINISFSTKYLSSQYCFLSSVFSCLDRAHSGILVRCVISIYRVFFFGEGGESVADGGSFSFLIGTKYCLARGLDSGVCLGDWTGEIAGDWMTGAGLESEGTNGLGGKGGEPLGSQDGVCELAAVNLG